MRLIHSLAPLANTKVADKSRERNVIIPMAQYAIQFQILLYGLNGINFIMKSEDIIAKADMA